MASEQQWNSLIYLSRDEFKHPEMMDYSILSALDRFIGIVGSRPVLLSDGRPGDPKYHGKGLAIDTTWPGQDPIEVWEKANSYQGFTGRGIYLNEMNVASFHFDTRPPKSDGTPAIWGGVITHPIDAATGEHQRRTDYTTAGTVIDIIKKNAIGSIIGLLALGLAIYLFTHR